VRKVVFACVENAGRSQMAAAFFNEIADPSQARALSAGTRPADSVHPNVAAAMREVGIDISAARPQRITDDFVRDAVLLVTMGCGDACPYVPGLEVDDWPLPDPKDQPLAGVRRIRDEVRARVERLVRSRGWSRRR
jgi:arsenate reductase (thioredoxin)